MAVQTAHGTGVWLMVGAACDLVQEHEAACSQLDSRLEKEKADFFFCLFPPIQAPNMKSFSVHLSAYSSTDGQELIRHHAFSTVMEVISRSISQINLSFLELLPVGYLATAMRK